MAEKPAVQGVQTALRAVSILEAFSGARPALTLSEISEVVELSVPTTHRLVKALLSRDLLVADQETRHYSLGPGVMRLARVIMQRDDLVELARPGLERLRSDIAETISLQRRIGDERVVIAELVSPQPIRTASIVGTRYPLVAGGAGKAILAFLPDDVRDRIVREHAADPAALTVELEATRDRGYALSSGEVVLGATSLAVPVFDSELAAIGSINITGPRERFPVTDAEEWAGLALEVAGTLTSLIGGVPWSDR